MEPEVPAPVSSITMKVVLQRVTEASVRVDGAVTGAIEHGLVLLVGVGGQDTAEDYRWMARKLAELRIFPDEADRMNRSVKDVGGACLAVSQFTLFGDTRKGRRPSFTKAGPPEMARDGFEQFCACLRDEGLRVETGIFQAHMEVRLVNDGPVTLILESPSERGACG
jgi:D-tyrosyl-tRNA(Tyr) deacylase